MANWIFLSLHLNTIIQFLEDLDSRVLLHFSFYYEHVFVVCLDLSKILYCCPLILQGTWPNRSANLVIHCVFKVICMHIMSSTSLISFQRIRQLLETLSSYKDVPLGVFVIETPGAIVMFNFMIYFFLFLLYKNNTQNQHLMAIIKPKSLISIILIRRNSNPKYLRFH